MVAATAKRLAAVINSLIRELDQRDETSTNVTGHLELALQSQTFELTIVQMGTGRSTQLTYSQCPSHKMLLTTRSSHQGAVSSMRNTH
jgi:hypothetical protein